MKELGKEIISKILNFQQNEITEHHIYLKLSKKYSGKNGEILEEISKDELSHYLKWKKYTGKDLKPSRLKIIFYTFLAFVFGITFTIKLMEGGEKEAELAYKEISEDVPEALEILDDEIKHERMLISMIDEEKLNYVSSMVLGINDAIVELTGALSGLAFALQKTSIVALAGLITGISAALSMGASEYLSQKAEDDGNPLKASLYTTLAYGFSVMLLVAPFFIFDHYLVALFFTLLDAFFIILFFTFFVSVVKEKEFKPLFWEMFFISFGVALLSFGVGILARKFLNIEL